MDPSSDATPKRTPFDLWTTLLYALLIAGGIALTVAGIVAGDLTVLAVGVLAIIVPAAVAPLLTARQAGGSGDDAQLLRQIRDRLNMTEVERRLSDRDRDREALRQAILTDIKQEDYEGALSLVDQMAEEFGYVAEAEEYRQRIIDARARHREQKIDGAMKEVNRLIEQYDWDGARRETERLTRLYPDVQRVKALPQRIDQAREEHKRELERDFLRAAEVGDTDKAMNLLKELDNYLTPEEAAPYLETARGVIGQARENLGVRFRLAISDKDWVDAVTSGEQIIREFPNSKMSDEVRGMLDVLRERAAGQRAAESGRTVETR